MAQESLGFAGALRLLAAICGVNAALRGQSAHYSWRGWRTRRPRTRRSQQPFPDAPGTATLRAFRKPAGGVAELAGTSTGTTVSVVSVGPLTAGVTYELWVAGHNSQGDDPESNHVSHTAV